MKQFNLEEWLANPEKKVVTAFGEPAKVVFTEGMGEQPVLAVIYDGDTTDSNWLTKDGKAHDGVDRLFFADEEPELTEFEKALEDFYNKHFRVCTYDNCGSVEDSLHDGAKELLELAREGLEPEILERLETTYENGKRAGKAEALKEVKKNWHDYFKPQDVTDIYNEGIRKGQSEALKNLPRWRKLKEPIVNQIAEYEFRQKNVLNGGYYIPKSDLEKLPKEE